MWWKFIRNVFKCFLWHKKFRNSIHFQKKKEYMKKNLKLINKISIFQKIKTSIEYLCSKLQIRDYTYLKECLLIYRLVGWWFFCAVRAKILYVYNFEFQEVRRVFQLYVYELFFFFVFGRKHYSVIKVQQMGINYINAEESGWNCFSIV